MTSAATDSDRRGITVGLVIAWGESRHEYSLAAYADVANTEIGNYAIHQVDLIQNITFFISLWQLQNEGRNLTGYEIRPRRSSARNSLVTRVATYATTTNYPTIITTAFLSGCLAMRIPAIMSI